MVPGAPACDAAVRLDDGRDSWLLHALGAEFTLLVYGEVPAATLLALAQAAEGVAGLALLRVVPGTQRVSGALSDRDGLVAQRYDLQDGSAVLLRPDQHVCARWRQPQGDALRQALKRALCLQ
jgi:3-(3-hydroxy-phenyl)propionate hydroxylase